MSDTEVRLTSPKDIQRLPVAFKKRGAAAKANNRRRPAASVPSPTESSSGYSSSDNETGHEIKRRKKNGLVTASSAVKRISGSDRSATNTTADRTLGSQHANDATKQNNWYDEDSRDASISSKQQSNIQPGHARAQLPDGIYRGLANQASFIQKNPDAPTKSIGPIKAPTNVRTTTVTDFAPDVCKDYKQTGFCGFGDNCKFLHDRSDYKQGWQLDRDWEIVTKGKKIGGKIVASANRNRPDESHDKEVDEDGMPEDIPFACIICKGPYKEPVVTKCAHYFCEPCALQRYKKDPSCAACGSGTNGVFNTAKTLKKILAKKRARADMEPDE